MLDLEDTSGDYARDSRIDAEEMLLGQIRDATEDVDYWMRLLRMAMRQDYRSSDVELATIQWARKQAERAARKLERLEGQL